MNRLEKVFCIFLIILGIFTFGVQVGIHQGRALEHEEGCIYDY